MTPKEFEEAFGYAPASHFDTKSRPKQKRRVRKTNKNAQIASYDDMPEEEHQTYLVQWLEATGLYFEISINGLYLPNPHPRGSQAYSTQAKSNARVLGKVKRQGWRKGQADVKIFLHRKELNIELKKMGGTATPEQKANVKRFESFDYADYLVVEGWTNAKEIIEIYIDKYHNI